MGTPRTGLDHTIKTRDDWERYRERLYWSDDRVLSTCRDQLAAARAKGLFVNLGGVEADETAYPVWGQVGIFTPGTERTHSPGGRVATASNSISSSVGNLAKSKRSPGCVGWCRRMDGGVRGKGCSIPRDTIACGSDDGTSSSQAHSS